MRNRFIGLLAIILGLIIIAFPMLGIISTSALFGLSTLLISIIVIMIGVSIMDYNKFGAILDYFLGIVMLIISLIIIFNPHYFAFLAAIMLYLAGIFIMIIGLVTLINNRHARYGFYIGVAGIVLGIIYIIIGTYVSDPYVLGILIGIWLLITGILKLIDG
ncbi:MAG: DUF308 domain-containing protein [Methanobrevibacter sp.]|uniref:DUF308 domain-containing protein n=1 Tax=Methanobrevibacter sp. TaxID=66852 RepID=UPI0026DFA2A1|nr:DUF308 domain-containing protein [Methanobrevibacter sp.]MDO5848377.1 DUF308 domain-containing protein [Methanobrevibacter sp.]